MKQNWLVCGPLTVLLFNRFGFQNLPLGPKSCRAFRKTGPRGPFETLIFIWMQTQAQNIFLGPKSFRDFRETGTWLHVSNVTGDEFFLTASLDFNGNSISLQIAQQRDFKLDPDLPLSPLSNKNFWIRPLCRSSRSSRDRPNRRLCRTGQRYTYTTKSCRKFIM